MLAGKDGSRALAKMSLDEADVRDEWDDLEDLTPFQRDSLSEWEMKFQTRYTEVRDFKIGGRNFKYNTVKPWTLPNGHGLIVIEYNNDHESHGFSCHIYGNDHGTRRQKKSKILIFTLFKLIGGK